MVEVVRCSACESTSFQVHRADDTLTFVCVHCGEVAAEPEPPEPPGTIEAIVAESIEHHSRYTNELRHPGMADAPEPRDQEEADELSAMQDAVARVASTPVGGKEE